MLLQWLLRKLLLTLGLIVLIQHGCQVWHVTLDGVPALLRPLVCCADWLLHEQVAVAAMDVHAISAAHKLVTAVVHKYPKSARAARLKVRHTYSLTGSATHSTAAGLDKPLACLQPAFGNIVRQAQHHTTSAGAWSKFIARGLAQVQRSTTD